jgi:hypothetical protein
LAGPYVAAMGGVAAYLEQTAFAQGTPAASDLEVDNRIPVFIDGGVRHGTDVFKALAVGAKGVGIGRPYIYGLGAFGQAGVDRVIEILQGELTLAMGQLRNADGGRDHSELCGDAGMENLSSVSARYNCRSDLTNPAARVIACAT